MLNPIMLANLRQRAIEWALGTASEGESTESIVSRADQYMAYVTYPLRQDVMVAMAERAAAVIN